MNFSQPLSQIPDGLREPLIKHYNEIERNYREHRWTQSELDGGKLCEVAYCILRGYVDGQYPAAPSKPTNFVQACRDLEKADKNTFRQAVRISIPRMLIALNEIRNNRGVGHVKGDVDSNHMDASIVLAGAKWIMAELVRHFHGLADVNEATAVVETLIERTNPLVWEVGENKRVLRPEMSMKDKTLVLLHGHPVPVHEDQLFAWVEHSNKAIYRRDVLRRSHRDKLVEFDEITKIVTLSPLGIQEVENRLLKKTN